MSSYSEYVVPKENYLHKPEDESCYEYLLKCYERISKDLGDYTAFVVPVADQTSSTPMSRLLSDIEKLAAYLNAKGYKKGDVLTAFLPTCAHAFPIVYALNKLGIISNFVHPLTPPAALEEIMETTKSKGLFILDLFAGAFTSVIDKYPTIVCRTSDYCDGVAKKYAEYNEAANAKVPEHENIRFFLDVLAEEHPAAETVQHMGKTDAFYLQGGGTTGKSKTIRLSSFAFNSLCYSYYLLDEPHDYKTSHSLCTLPCFHAYGLVGGMMYPLCNAFKPILVAKFDPVQANGLIKKFNIAEILAVPKMFEKLYETEGFSENEGLKNLKMAFVGGDIVTAAFVDKFDDTIHAMGSTARLGRGFGLTEMSAGCTSNGGAHYKKESTGYPMAGVDIEIWDDDCKKLPAGEVGEIVASGPNMMNGYLPDGNINFSGIYTDENGKNWIRTGDMGYLDEDGYMYFSGRKKRIIIIAGYNIYPSTIEQLVATLDCVSEVCAVQGYNDLGKPEVKLCVSFVEGSDKEKCLEEVKNLCSDKIEGYACPRKFEVHDLLPRTKMEKIDFLALSDKVPAMA